MTMHETHSHHEGSTNDGNGGMRVGPRKGIRAYFDVDDITIAFWGSAWTGREVVTIEDRVVSRRWSPRFVSEHRFEHAGIRYRIVFQVVSILRGELYVELYRDGRLIDSDHLRQSELGLDPDTGRFSAWRLVRRLTPYFLLGMMIGAAVGFLVSHC